MAHGRGDAGRRQQPLNLRGAEVGHPDGAREPELDAQLHLGPRVREGGGDDGARPAGDGP